MAQTRRLRNFVNGEYVDTFQGLTTHVVNPTTGDVFAEAPLSTQRDIDKAYAAAASAFPSEIGAYVAPTLRSWWLPVHVILAGAGEAAFAVAFAAAVLRLFASGRPGGLLPAADKLEDVECRAVTLGYPLFTAGALVAGALWAEQAWGAWWNWEPKQICSLIVFLLATAYLYARHGRGWRGARASVLAILLFAVAA